MGPQLPHTPKTHLVIAGVSGPGAWLLDPAAYETKTPGTGDITFPAEKGVNSVALTPLGTQPLGWAQDLSD